MASLRDKTFLAALASGLARQTRWGLAQIIRTFMEVGIGLAGYLLGFVFSMAFGMLFLGAWLIPLLNAAVSSSSTNAPTLACLAVSNLAILAYWHLLASREYALFAVKPVSRIDRFHAWISAPMAAMFLDMQTGMSQIVPHPSYAALDPERARQSLRLAIFEGLGSKRLAPEAFGMGWQSSRSVMGPLCNMCAFFCTPLFWLPPLVFLGLARLIHPKPDPLNPAPSINPIARMGRKLNSALEGVAAHGAKARADAERADIELAARGAPSDAKPSSHAPRL